ncbi:MAG: toll/interleukin-1 receptor domain-containing protein [Clostridia bacterium]|nr:toll/interleukin-1 receptor domain-containing protein [Clostridia bacterium]
MSNPDKGFIFLSHSHEDIKNVRRVRNYLEDIGCNPIMLYLRGTDRPNTIKRIIKHEISARENFIYCNSPAAERSKWVTMERNFVRKMHKKPRVEEININEDFESKIVPILNKFKLSTTVFVSRVQKDAKLADRITEKLEAADYLVLGSKTLQVGKNWGEQVSDMISEACKDGFLILLITPNSPDTQTLHIDKILKAEKNGGKIVPVFVGAKKTQNKYGGLFKRFQGINVSLHPSDKELDSLMRQIQDITS